MPQPQNRPLCMDARMLGTAEGTGVSSYARSLHDALGLLTREPVMLLADAPALGEEPSARLGRPGRWLRALMPMSRRAKQSGELFVAKDIFRAAQVYFDIHGKLLPVRLPGAPGIMHWTYPVPIRAVGWANIYTVHDAIPLVRPDLTTIDPFRHRWLLARIVDEAAAIATVSEAARHEIIDALGCRSSLVVNCGQAVGSEPAPIEALPPEIEAGRYLLVCGTVERRKNIAAILAAYRASGVSLPLVLAGPDGLGAEQIATDIDATAGAIRLPYLADEAMRALIGHARALLMPSLAEGFGLPVAEAMALGVPVITSNAGAVAETAAKAALLVDPTSVDDIAEAIRRVASDDALCLRLGKAGQRNTKRFTVRRFARQLKALHVKALHAEAIARLH